MEFNRPISTFLLRRRKWSSVRYYQHTPAVRAKCYRDGGINSLADNRLTAQPSRNSGRENIQWLAGALEILRSPEDQRTGGWRMNARP
ncbi:hypothetical protein RRG08_053845 [Elysia crispata]|uniref:Uncharacterized protein n=1 Tax=Elysia crispata TaxID=231223 RepID=A0AAE1A6L1_9GAST|nr:hypothetical protein RRG08_053845 [Elysia crispata]